MSLLENKYGAVVLFLAGSAIAWTTAGALGILAVVAGGACGYKHFAESRDGDCFPESLLLFLLLMLLSMSFLAEALGFALVFAYVGSLLYFSDQYPGRPAH